MEKESGNFSKKVDKEFMYDPTIPLTGTYPKELKTSVQTLEQGHVKSPRFKSHLPEPMPWQMNGVHCLARLGLAIPMVGMGSDWG